MRASVYWLVFAGCALTSKATPLEIRYFSPETSVAVSPETPRTRVSLETASSRMSTGEPGPVARLRLGRITESALLQYRIVYRRSPVELDRYDTLRWTERPEAYVRRSLARALFDEHPLEQAIGGRGPTLDIEVISFEQFHRRGRVQLRFQLDDDRAVLARGTVVVEREATSEQMDRIVVAIGAALDAASADIADRVEAALRARTLDTDKVSAD